MTNSDILEIDNLPRLYRHALVIRWELTRFCNPAHRLCRETRSCPANGRDTLDRRRSSRPAGLSGIDGSDCRLPFPGEAENSRAASFQDALYCYRAMMHLRLQDFPALLSWTNVSTSFWIVVMLVVEWVNRREDYGLPMKRVHAKAVRYAVYLLLIAIIVLYFDSGTPRFIYFQF